jgi:hypothetical protein
MMQVSFHTLALVTAGIFLLIAIVWLFAPARFLTAWGVKDSAETRLIGRRVAALYAGVAVMFFIARDAEPSLPRTALSVGLVSTCLLLAISGVVEWLQGRASKGILAAAVIELLLSLLFVQGMSSAPAL